MRDSQRQPGRIRADTAGWPIPALVDDARATYMEWRETTDAIAESYGRWSVAPAAERAPRFAAYIAALDQEQSAAAVYAESISQFERWLPHRDPGATV